ncbi:MAG: glycoside hydrolase family 5 protein [Planctomycetes bacterium]|nr:glycoside hydrolase family 5 protein [Planctomycetota bacterium]
MKRGINIGNHFEQTPVPGVEFADPMQDWYYRTIKELGFDHVRLPVKWSSHTDDNNGFRIDERVLGMVQKAILEFLAKDLSVVLNIHHFREAMDDPKANQEKIYAIWEQLALHFKDYPDTLIFEVMNEPTWKADARDWNEVQNNTVARIRKTNPVRKVMIGGIDYTGLFALKDLVPPENDPNLIASFHYYFPLEFTHQGASWSPTYKDVKGVSWQGTQEEIDDIRNGIRDNAKAWSDRYGIPMNLGEFGALSTADMDSRARYTRCVRDVCEEFGISWTYWEFNGGFGISSKTGELIMPLVDALLGE